jgi:hypothetical protein
MQKPTLATGIRNHALAAFYRSKESMQTEKTFETGFQTIAERLGHHHNTRKLGGLDDLDIASECADHLLAGIDTTSHPHVLDLGSVSSPEP